MSGSGRAERSDARQNRRRLIDAARRAFSADPGATMKSIAAEAGVGQGTIYRHFPDREALLVAVYREDVERLVEIVPDLLSRHQPLAALGEWLEEVAAYGRIKHGASLAVAAATNLELGRHYYPPVVAALGDLLRACQDAGQVRGDVDADEVLLLVSFLWKTDTGKEWERRTRNMLGVVLDGLRAGASTPS